MDLIKVTKLLLKVIKAIVIILALPLPLRDCLYSEKDVAGVLFGRGRDRGFVLYISLFLRALGWWVCVCLYTRVHKHKLLGCWM